MVLIHIKRTETDQFLYETNTKASVDEVIRDLVRRAGATLRFGLLDRLHRAQWDVANPLIPARRRMYISCPVSAALRRVGGGGGAGPRQQQAHSHPAAGAGMRAPGGARPDEEAGPAGN